MRNALTTQPAVTGVPVIGARRPEVELILPVRDREDDIRRLLADAASCLVGVAVPAAIAVVDRGSSDRTVEAVDEVAAAARVPVRVLGCSAPGWGRAALRGISTSLARWVLFGEPETFQADTAPVLDHAFRLLSEGQHIVCTASEERHQTILETAVAALLFSDQPPDGPDFVPVLRDTPAHAGLRMTAVAGPARVPGDGDRDAVLEPVAR